VYEHESLDKVLQIAIHTVAGPHLDRNRARSNARGSWVDARLPTAECDTRTASPLRRFDLTDAFDHSLERPETLANVYGILGRMHLVASAPVIKEAQECCRHLVDLYSHPNMTVEQISTALRESKHPLLVFGVACRVELDQYVIH
jgi:hypothetical protein